MEPSKYHGIKGNLIGKTYTFEQFWNDMQESMEKGEEDYFIGSIVLTREEARQFSIQDGQQRLTTYSMMIAVLRTKLPERYENDAQRITRSIPQNRIPTGREDTRIRHQEHERSKYSGRKLMVKGPILTESSLKACNLLHEKADDMITQHGLEEAEKLFNYLVESVIAIRVINKPENATQIFEISQRPGEETEPSRPHKELPVLIPQGNTRGPTRGGPPELGDHETRSRSPERKTLGAICSVRPAMQVRSN